MKDWKYILYLTVAFGLFVAMKLLSPKEYDWSVTYGHEDKNPYGTFAMTRLLPALFPNLRHSYKTLYELTDSIAPGQNIFVITTTFSPGSEDTESLLEHVADGGTAFIAAQYYHGKFRDTLKLNSRDYIFRNVRYFNNKDSAYLKFVTPQFDTTSRFYYRRNNISIYFSRFDTARTTVVMQDELEQPVMLKVTWGKGSIYLCSTPMIFTNIYLLANDNHQLVSQALSYLPPGDVMRTEFYHLGRMEAGTPLRFVLSDEALSWAYYLTIITLLVFIVFEMKRRQRIIPVIHPLPNTTLEFVGTIGNLYYQKKDHKNIAEKKIHYFLEYIRATYGTTITLTQPDAADVLARKAGKPQAEVQQLVADMRQVHNAKHITAEQLMRLNRKLEQFYKTNSRTEQKKRILKPGFRGSV